MLTKKQFIKDFKKDDMVNDIFVVKFKKPVEQYKNGFKFELRIGDSSREIMYKFWGPADEAKVNALYNSIKKDDVLHVQGRVNEWNGNLEISANDSNPLTTVPTGQYRIEDFIRKSTKDPENMWGELLGYIASVQNIELRKLLEHFFKDPTFAKNFKDCPAAMYVHHGWIHGLLEHTLPVVKIAEFFQKQHPSLDRDLVITGAIFHDMGKIEEFQMTTSIKMTNEGMLVGHVSVATDKLSKAMDVLKTPAELRLKVLHMIITHMGEYGSSKKPSFPEALALYLADKADADLMHMVTLKDEALTEDDSIYHKDFGNIFLR